MRYADLHLHTTRSDGTRTPGEVIDLAVRLGLGIVAISDHDQLAGFFEIREYAVDHDVTLIPAVELSCIYAGHDIHVLAYAFRADDSDLSNRLATFRGSRLNRGAQIVKRLAELGFPLDESRIHELTAGGSLGRPHVARAMVERGYVASVSEAFDRFLAHGRPADIPKERFKVAEAVAVIRAAGGLTSIAHPSLYPDHRSIVNEILDQGVDGIEVFHPDVGAEDRTYYEKLARSRNALITGGSDDHGTVKEKETIGTVRVPEALIRPILDRMSAGR